MASHLDISVQRSSRTPLIVAGALLAALALASLIAGAALTGVHATKRDRSGFYASGSHLIATPSRALVARDLDVGAGQPRWLLDHGPTLRISATASGQRPAFVGIARRDQLDVYLRGVRYDEIRDFDLDPFTVTTSRHAGSTAPVPPAESNIWAASADGTGQQTVKWDPQKGDWAVAVMNADGSRNVAAQVSLGARTDIVLWSGIVLIGAAALLGAAGTVLIVSGLRRPAVG